MELFPCPTLVWLMKIKYGRRVILCHKLDMCCIDEVIYVDDNVFKTVCVSNVFQTAELSDIFVFK